MRFIHFVGQINSFSLLLSSSIPQYVHTAELFPVFSDYKAAKNIHIYGFVYI